MPGVSGDVTDRQARKIVTDSGKQKQGPPFRPRDTNVLFRGACEINMGPTSIGPRCPTPRI